MTTIGKCLAVLVTVLCLAFLGFVSASLVGGPGYEGHLNDPELDDFVFSQQDGGWAVVTRERLRDPANPRAPAQHFDVLANSPLAVDAGENPDDVLDQALSRARTTPVLAEAIIKARRFKKQKQEQELQRLQTELNGGAVVQWQDAGGRGRAVVPRENILGGEQNIKRGAQVEARLLDGRVVNGTIVDIVPGLQARLDYRRQINERDLEAMKKRVQDVEQALAAGRKKEQQLRVAAIEKSNESLNKRQEANRRREDVSRLRDQKAILEADKERARLQKRELQKTLVRLQSEIERLLRRRTLLIDSGADPDYDGTEQPTYRETPRSRR